MPIFLVGFKNLESTDLVALELDRKLFILRPFVFENHMHLSGRLHGVPHDVLALAQRLA